MRVFAATLQGLQGAPWWRSPCKRTWVMVHRKPASMEAPMTTRKPTKLNSVSPATSSRRPSAMMTTTPAKPQLGLHIGRPNGGSQLIGDDTRLRGQLYA